MAQVFTYTSILDGSNYALIGEFVKFGLCLGIFFYMDYTIPEYYSVYSSN